ncbi:porin family protein [Idiomarina sp. HP20-50]|uniref:porin family protein n=1 Tax=Idiomarina sp. HP20-50 TaxID=3070813 RepID=UPI00294ACCBF|nr:porin family protein [Idiomarina sp. HP20-50]MDV6314861.1 porin family protein [Idiomarina sp. HP20-50]
MTFLRTILAGTAFLLFSVFAHAQDSGYYGAVSLAQLNVDSELIGSPSFTPHTANLMLGYRYSNSLSAEARYGFGVHSSSDKGVKFETDYSASILAKPRLYLSPEVALYVTGGFTRGKFRVGGQDTTLNSLSYGAGIQYDRNPRTTYFIDWIKLIDKDEYTINALNIGVTYRF